MGSPRFGPKLGSGNLNNSDEFASGSSATSSASVSFVDRPSLATLSPEQPFLSKVSKKRKAPATPLRAGSELVSDLPSRFPPAAFAEQNKRKSVPSSRDLFTSALASVEPSLSSQTARAGPKKQQSVSSRRDPFTSAWAPFKPSLSSQTAPAGQKKQQSVSSRRDPLTSAWAPVKPSLSSQTAPAGQKKQQSVVNHGDSVTLKVKADGSPPVKKQNLMVASGDLELRPGVIDLEHLPVSKRRPGRRSNNDLSINIHGFTFYSFPELDAWVGRMAIGSDRIEAWAHIITQLAPFFRGRSTLSEKVIKAVSADPSFKLCKWAKEDIDTLLRPIRPIQVHVEASNGLRNRSEEAFNCINREWGKDAALWIRNQGYLGRTLRLIASVAVRRDVENLRTGLLLVNTQAVRRITEGKTHFSGRLFLTPDDWKQGKDLPVPSRDLLFEELTVAGVHINSAGVICAGRPLLPLPLLDDEGRDQGQGNSSGDSDVVGGHGKGDAAGAPNPSANRGKSDFAGRGGRAHPSGKVKRRGSAGDLATGGDLVAGGGLPPRSDMRPVKDSPPPPGGGDGPPVADSRSRSETALADQRNIVLGGWLCCRDCSGLQTRWCEAVLCPQRIDLVGGLGILGAYFYAPIRLCESHLPLLAQSVQLINGQPRVLHSRLKAMWEISISINHLAEFVDSHRDWFVSPVAFSRSSFHNVGRVEEIDEGDMDGSWFKDGENEENDEDENYEDENNEEEREDYDEEEREEIPILLLNSGRQKF